MRCTTSGRARTRARGVPVPSDLAPLVFATVHPSSILRAQDEPSREREYEAFVRDLRAVAQAMA